MAALGAAVPAGQLAPAQLAAAPGGLAAPLALGLLAAVAGCLHLSRSMA